MLIWFLIVSLFLYWIYRKFIRDDNFRSRSNRYTAQTVETLSKPSEIIQEECNIPAYHKKWMFSYNEKDAYFKLKAIADEVGCTVFAKVRLLDLLEPIKEHPKYKTHLYKIQAKHVDFVICDERLVARCIIELDDNSHKSLERQERDKFVDSVLKGSGYTVVHAYGITDLIKPNPLKIYPVQ